ncbi:MAG: FtsQ-type POTRA domain-containing protein [Pseudomonadota bacterium]
MRGRRPNYRLNTPGGPPGVRVRSVRTGAVKIAADAGIALLAGAILVGFFMSSKVLLGKIRGSDTFRLHSVVIEGNKRFEQDDVMKLGRLHKGMSIFDVDPKGVEELLERQPWVKDADVKRVLPDGLTIHMQERVRAATLLIADVLYFVDREGVIFERQAEGEEIKTVLITGVDEEFVAQSRELVGEEIRRILQFIERYNNMGLGRYAAIGEVHRETGGELVVFTKTEAREIRFGNGRYVKKIKNLRTLLEYLDRKDGTWDYILLDSDAFPDRIVVNLR